MTGSGVQPPFVSISGLTNFRDIGGWPIEDGEGKVVSTVRKCVFYRGPDTATVTDEGLVKLKGLGISTGFDLRSKGQIEKAGGFKDLQGIHRVWGIVEAFTEILTHGAAACRTMLLHVAAMSSQAPTACYIHCTTGNNRSGVFVSIILSLLGVKAELVAEEYKLSGIGLRPSRDAVVERLMKNPVFSKSGGGGQERAERMVGARPESMLAMLEMVERKWGGADKYVKTQCGLTDEEIAKVRNVLTRPNVVAAKKRNSRAWETLKEILHRLRNAFG
ncbi:tyrosine phosphatase [Diplocarpon rosae]|nr:tyrosine phosphatase [Diplocarpon rosae]